jgi:hypothetical protein
VISVVRDVGNKTYDMFHQIVLQPWMGQGTSNTVRDFEYNTGLCPEGEWKDVPICSRYACTQWDATQEKCIGEWVVGSDGHVLCETFVYRPACVGSFLGNSFSSCNRLPCTNNLHNASVTFNYTSWDGFGGPGTLSSGGMHHGRGGELRLGPGDFSSHAVLLGWHHGNICVKKGAGPPPAPTEVSVTTIAYVLHGARNQNLRVTLTVARAENTPVAGASVRFTLLNATTGRTWNGSGTTDSNGQVSLNVNNAPNGTYRTTVNSVTASGLDWDGHTPENAFVK